VCVRRYINVNLIIGTERVFNKEYVSTLETIRIMLSTTTIHENMDHNNEELQHPSGRSIGVNGICRQDEAFELQFLTLVITRVGSTVEFQQTQMSGFNRSRLYMQLILRAGELPWKV
jgi:hypothetical protein